jgi:hypothetical protein
MVRTEQSDLRAFRDGWDGHRHRHCIWIVSPAGYKYSCVFDEVAEALEEAFVELGGSAPIVRLSSEWAGRIPIILGGNLLPSMVGISLPPRSIFINLEQITEANPWIREDYLSLLKRYPVLDYSPRNRTELQKAGIAHAGLLEIGYSPVLTRIAQDAKKDIDVLFYGSSIERRRTIIDRLNERGLHAVRVFNVFGAERDALIARAKIVINIHYYPSNVFEIVRVSYLLANRTCVVSEGDMNDPDLAPFRGGLEVAPYEELVERCIELAGNEARRDELARRGFERISARRQSDLLRECVRSSGG